MTRLLHFLLLHNGAIEHLELFAQRMHNLQPVAQRRNARFVERALPHARDLGNGFQLTNMLRDIDEDLGLNRLYMPRDHLERFGVTDFVAGQGEVPPSGGAGRDTNGHAASGSAGAVAVAVAAAATDPDPPSLASRASETEPTAPQRKF